VTVLTTYGGARVCGLAAAEALAGPGTGAVRVA
jgi:beta-N-acetylhexosaminidase